MTEPQRRFQQTRQPGANRPGRTGAPVAQDGGRPGGERQSSTADHAVIGGRYVIEARIGEGAHAITYRAHDQRLKRTVAIKVLRSHLSSDTELVSRFVREAELAASISHPNVVDVYDVGTDGDVSFIVMRLVPGHDLKEIIQTEGRLGVGRAIPLVHQILRGLGAIHTAGIVHRDVKPQNILITPDGTAQVTDFGVAYAALAEGLTIQGMTVGTASYMAPEQARGEPVTQATDVYAVGVVFYEMLTGRVPFTGENPMAVMLAHLQSRPVPPSQAVPDLQLPSRIEEIVLRAMAKDPAQRFASTGAMAEALSGGGLAPVTPVIVRASPGLSAEATTVIGPAARVAGIPASGERTVVGPSVGGYGQAPPPRAVAPPWLAGQGSGQEPPAPTMAPESSGGHRRGRGWLVALLAVLFGVLAVGAVAVATQFGPFEGSGGDDGTVPAGVAVGATEPTGTVEPDAQPTAGENEPTATTEPAIPTDAPTVTATAPPTVTATAPPTMTATAPPTVTATTPSTATAIPPTETAVPPTRTPAPTFTPVPPTVTTPPRPTSTVAPTVPPPTETPSIVEVSPTRERGPAGNAADEAAGPGQNGNGNAAAGAQLLTSSGDGTDSITIAPSDWAGAYSNLDTGFYGRDCVAVYGQGSGYETATLTFTLDGVPEAGVTLTISGLDDEYDGTNPFSIEVNGQRLTTDRGPVAFPQWDGQTGAEFGQFVLSLDSNAFVEGQNSITIINDAPGGVVNEGPYLLLGEGTLEIA